MEAFAIPPSRRVGELRKLCEDAIERGDLLERQPVAVLRRLPERQGISVDKP